MPRTPEQPRNPYAVPVYPQEELGIDFDSIPQFDIDAFLVADGQDPDMFGDLSLEDRFNYFEHKALIPNANLLSSATPPTYQEMLQMVGLFDALSDSVKNNRLPQEKDRDLSFIAKKTSEYGIILAGHEQSGGDYGSEPAKLLFSIALNTSSKITGPQAKAVSHRAVAIDTLSLYDKSNPNAPGVDNKFSSDVLNLAIDSCIKVQKTNTETSIVQLLDFADEIIGTHKDDNLAIRAIGKTRAVNAREKDRIVKGRNDLCIMNRVEGFRARTDWISSPDARLELDRISRNVDDNLADPRAIAQAREQDFGGRTNFLAKLDSLREHSAQANDPTISLKERDSIREQNIKMALDYFAAESVTPTGPVEELVKHAMEVANESVQIDPGKKGKKGLDQKSSHIMEIIERVTNVMDHAGFADPTAEKVLDELDYGFCATIVHDKKNPELHSNIQPMHYALEALLKITNAKARHLPLNPAEIQLTYQSILILAKDMKKTKRIDQGESFAVRTFNSVTDDAQKQRPSKIKSEIANDIILSVQKTLNDREFREAVEARSPVLDELLSQIQHAEMGTFVVGTAKEIVTMPEKFTRIKRAVRDSL